MTRAIAELLRGKSQRTKWAGSGDRGKRLGWVVLVVIVAAGVGLLIWATRWGPGGYSDSVAYLVAARNLVRGIGLGFISASGRYRPLSHFPPLYPLTLGLLDGLNIPELEGARWLNVALFALFLILPAWILGRSWSPWTGALWAGCNATIPVIFTSFSQAISEPLALSLGFGGLFLLLQYLRMPRTALWILSAFGTGLAALARYHALAFAITGALLFAVANSKKGWARVREVVGYGLVAFGPMLLWLTILWLGTRATARLGVALPADPWAALRPARVAVLQVVWGWTGIPVEGWFATYRVRVGVLLGTLILGLVLAIVGLRKRSLPSMAWMGWFGALMADGFLIAHLAVFGFATIATFPPPDATDRTLMPLLPAGLLYILSVHQACSRSDSVRRFAPSLLNLVLVAFILAWGPRTVQLADRLHNDGDGYMSRAWRESSTFETLQRIPADVPIISNEAALVLFYTDRPTYGITELYDLRPLPGYPAYGSDPSDGAQRAFREEGGMLVLFRSVYWQFYSIYEEETSARLAALVDGLVVVSREADADIYRYPQEGTPLGAGKTKPKRWQGSASPRGRMHGG